MYVLQRLQRMIPADPGWITEMGWDDGGGDAKGRKIPPNGILEEAAVEADVGSIEVVVRIRVGGMCTEGSMFGTDNSECGC